MAPQSGSGTGTPVAPGPVVAATPTPEPWPLLPLDSWRELMGFNPWHFWGLENTTIPVTSACNDRLTKHAWQNTDAAGREEILTAIFTAEERLREHLRFSVAPRYTEETLSWPRFHDQGVWNYGRADASGRALSVQLSQSKVQALGVEALTLLGTAAITFSDSDSDGIEDTFTVSIATTETNPDEIAVYFAAADRLHSEAAGNRWRITPVRVTISSGTATIKGRKWLLVKPYLYEGWRSAALNPDTASNFVTTLEIYQRQTNGDGLTNQTAQALFTWETPPWPTWACCDGVGSDSSSDPAAIATSIARVGLRDAPNGLVTPGPSAYDSTTGTWAGLSTLCRPPDRVTIRYLAGEALDAAGQMDRKWRVVVARLAAAELNRKVCACGEANREVYAWQFDLSRAAGANQEQYQISAEDLNNPLGTRRGHVYAWKTIQSLRLLRGFAF